MIRKFVTKPQTVKAICFKNEDETLEQLFDIVGDGCIIEIDDGQAILHFINSKREDQLAKEGDYVVSDVSGELFALSEKEFMSRYELLTEPESTKPIVTLKRWGKVGTEDSNFLVGQAYGHPRFEDGTLIRSSRVIDDRGMEVETVNSIYLLEGKNEA